MLPPPPISGAVNRSSSNPTSRFECQVILDVYATTREIFNAPPVEGLDDRAFRPVGRHEAPERFGPNIMPPNGIPDPSPDVLNQLIHANYCYRVKVSLTEPQNLDYLARALTTAASLCLELDGVIRDTATGVVLTHGEARRVLKSPDFTINDHVLIHTVKDPDGQGLWLHTHGLPKFGRSDLEMRRIPEQHQAVAAHGLLTIANYMSQGNVVKPAQILQLGDGYLTFTAAPDSTFEEFTYGLLRVHDLDPDTRMPKPGVMDWLESVLK